MTTETDLREQVEEMWTARREWQMAHTKVSNTLIAEREARRKVEAKLDAVLAIHAKSEDTTYTPSKGAHHYCVGEAWSVYIPYPCPTRLAAGGEDE